MTDVQMVAIGLYFWKIIDFISESNYLPVWENISVGERLQHAAIILPLLFSNLQVHTLKALVYRPGGLDGYYLLISEILAADV